MTIPARQLLRGPLDPRVIANLPPAASLPGAQVLGNDGLIYTSQRWPTTADPFAWVPSNTSQLLDAPIAVTVGEAGDFPDLADALDYLSGFIPAATTARILATVTILSGHTCVAPVRLVGVSLGWVRILAQDDAVPVANSAYIQEFEGTPPTFSFFDVFNATCPEIVCKFTCSNTQWDGILMDDPASPAVGYQVRGITLRRSALYQPLFIFEQTELMAAHSGFVGFSVNAFVGGGSFARLIGDGNNGQFDDAKSVGIMVQQSEVSLRALTATGAGTFGLWVRNGRAVISGGKLTVNDADPSKPSDFRRTEGVDGTQDIAILDGAQVYIDTIPMNGALGGSNKPRDQFDIDGGVYTESGTATWVGMIQPATYTVATLPAAADHDGKLVNVSDGDAGSPCLARSNGTDWLRVALGAAVSAT